MKQNKIYTIGLTGGIATGKSTVTEILKQAGIKVIDADLISKEILEPYKEGWYEVVAYFGNDFVNDDFTIKRKALADRIFSNPDDLMKINSLLHPIIIEKIRAKVNEYEKQGVKLAFIDAPLLFETGLEKDYDEVWLLVCGIDEQIRRVMVRDGLTYEQAENIIKNQMSDSEKRAKANRVIDTSDSLESTIRHVKTLLEEILDEI
ncbi:MAG: dephospho-CoA kinase [Clostridia bacterium]|nr:dephospho-CoA kinase [Clostridia bacterium]